MGDFELPITLLGIIAVVIAIVLARKLVGCAISLVILLVALAAAGYYLYTTGIIP